MIPRLTRHAVNSVAAALMLCLPQSSAALFSGEEQFDRDDLNSERRLDPEYFIATLAYRPFWRDAPAAARPKAFARTTDGSISGDEFYSERDIGVHGAVRPETFVDYSLRQRYTPEEDFF